MNNRSVLAVGAHPDDVEFMMAGTLLRLAEQGWTPRVFVMASGNCGTASEAPDAIRRTRLAETRAAAEALGAVLHPPITDDLEILYTLPMLRQVAAVIRAANPGVILTHSPEDYMEDHMITCRLTVTAAFARGMCNFRTEPVAGPVEGACVLYHALPYGLRDGLGRHIRPELYVNIAPVLAQKRRALSCHQSQKRWLDQSQGLDSYLDTMEAMSREVGAWSGRFPAAEGWRRHAHLGFCEAADNPLSDVLGTDAHLNPDYVAASGG